MTSPGKKNDFQLTGFWENFKGIMNLEAFKIKIIIFEWNFIIYSKNITTEICSWVSYRWAANNGLGTPINYTIKPLIQATPIPKTSMFLVSSRLVVVFA